MRVVFYPLNQRMSLAENVVKKLYSLLQFDDKYIDFLADVVFPGDSRQVISDGLSSLAGAGDDTVGRRADLLTRDYLMQMVTKAI